jgi:hypothetical protein
MQPKSMVIAELERAAAAALAPIERFAAIVETGETVEGAVSALRDLHRRMKAAGLQSSCAPLYRPNLPATMDLLCAMLRDMQDRIGCHAVALSEAVADFAQKASIAGERIIKLPASSPA